MKHVDIIKTTSVFSNVRLAQPKHETFIVKLKINIVKRIFQHTKDPKVFFKAVGKGQQLSLKYG